MSDQPNAPEAARALRILGVFAHPDDETFCAGGTFARYTAAGAQAMVLSATRGDAGQIRDASIATRRTLGMVRESELRLACECLGVQDVVCLDYGDGTLKDLDPAILTRDVIQIIRTFRPDVVITFGDDGAYGHPDHVTISRVATAACRMAGDAAQHPEQLSDGVSPHQPARLYHSHFPRSRLLLLERLVQWLVTHEQRFQGTFDFARALLLLAEETTALRYTSDYVDVSWFPRGFYIVEQGEPATTLYMILSGRADIIQEESDGTLHHVNNIGPGAFFGEQGLAYHRPRNAHVVAADDVTCLVFSPAQPTLFAGRGEGANLDLALAATRDDLALQSGATTCIDVTDYVERKIAALAAHRSQYPITPDMLPLAMLQEMMGREYFVQIFPPRQMETELLTEGER
jgi:LmbE family N-acetylglucosaminyl deacetylase